MSSDVNATASESESEAEWDECLSPRSAGIRCSGAAEAESLVTLCAVNLQTTDEGTPRVLMVETPQ